MLDFNNIKLLDHDETIYLPADLMGTFFGMIDYKRPDIEYKVLQPLKIAHNKKRSQERRMYVEKHCRFFDGTPHECHEDRIYWGLISKISPDWIYENIKYFYFDGDEEDEEVKVFRGAYNKPKLFVFDEEYSDSIELDLDSRKFTDIGSYYDFQNMRDLMKLKHLTEDDIMLILNTVNLK